MCVVWHNKSSDGSSQGLCYVKQPPYQRAAANTEVVFINQFQLTEEERHPFASTLRIRSCFP